MNPKRTEKEMPPTTGGTVVGLFRDPSQAERAINALKDAGFADDRIGVVMRDRQQQKDLAESTGTKAGEGAATGAVGGGIVGGTLGLLAGVGALAIPGIGPIIAGGALASTLAGAGIGAAAGGLLGALVGMGIPEEHARHFEHGVREGGVLVTVQAGPRAGEADRILRANGADLGPMAATATGAGTTTDTERLQLREEQLRAETQPVETGEVRVRKDVVTEEKTMDVPVTREEVVVERRPVSGQPASGQIPTEGEEIRVPIVEEEVQVKKTPVVKEEVTVGKRKVDDVERVSETVRREEARVETRGDAELKETYGLGAQQRRGPERRVRRDPSYMGPERRVAMNP